MTILKTLIMEGQVYLRKSYTTSSKFIEITRHNNTGNAAVSTDF